MATLPSEIAKAARRAVRMVADRGGAALDYSEASIAVVEDILAESAEYAGQMSESQLRMLSEDFGSYILEVARRKYGGRLLWHEDREPILVVGDDKAYIGIVTWGKVLRRLSGDKADDIVFFYQGFAERVRLAEPGVRALYV